MYFQGHNFVLVYIFLRYNAARFVKALGHFSSANSLYNYTLRFFTSNHKDVSQSAVIPSRLLINLSVRNKCMFCSYAFDVIYCSRIQSQHSGISCFNMALWQDKSAKMVMVKIHLNKKNKKIKIKYIYNHNF